MASRPAKMAGSRSPACRFSERVGLLFCTSALGQHLLFHCHHQSHCTHDSARRGQNHRPQLRQSPHPHPALLSTCGASPTSHCQLHPVASATLPLSSANGPRSLPARPLHQLDPVASARFSGQVALTPKHAPESPGRLSRSISQPPLQLGALPQGF